MITFYPFATKCSVCDYGSLSNTENVNCPVCGCPGIMKKCVMSKEDMPKEYMPKEYDNVNHPKHYTQHPSGVECIIVTEHMNFCLGNAMKYIWRAGLKGQEVEDLKKAAWYLNREIERRSKQIEPTTPTI